MSNQPSFSLSTQRSILVRQKLELGEFAGFETRNKYSVESESGEALAFAAEQQKSWWAFLVRQYLGHWREFSVFFFDANRNQFMTADHPFRIFFQRLEVRALDGRLIGVLQQRFSLLHKVFDVLDGNGNLLMTVNSPIWRPWTFPFQKQGQTVASIVKQWSGALAEMLTDKDNFKIEFSDQNLSEDERLILLAASVFIDLQYFERKAN